jgi:CO/xanthine dehydrogenase Mo-binding subunit
MSGRDLSRSLVDNPELDRWVRFEAGGKVWLGTGKVEIGQGVLTALRQIAAEELEVTEDRIQVTSGDTSATPEEGFTAGSQSIEASGGAIRLVCAEVRALAVAEAARQLNTGTEQITLTDGAFFRDGEATGLSYWSLSDALDLHRPATGAFAFRPAAQWRAIGRSTPRLDLPAKLASGGFIHDMLPAGVLHARILRRPYYLARLVELDEARIRRAGAVDIIRLGDFVAVTAEDEAVAERAVEVAARAAAWDGVHDAQPAHADPRHLQTLPAVDRVVTIPAVTTPGQSVRTLEATYTRPYITHASIAPSCALALWDGADLAVWTHSQGVGPLRRSLARALKLDPERITVRHAPGAGCYGHNAADDAALDASLVALQRPGRTVRVRWSREDEMSAAPVGGASVVTMRAALSADGRPALWEMEIWSPPHSRRPGSNGAINLLAEQALPGAVPDPGADDVPDASGGGGNRNSVVLYDLPGQRVLHHLVRETPLRTSSLRGLGAQANIFAIESFVDELAEAAGQCALAYRLAMLSDRRARQVIEAVGAMAGWEERGAGGEGRGVGIAFSRYKNRAAYLAAIAEVEVDTEVKVHRIWCAVDAGLVINPDGAANQIAGGAIQATSWTLKEQVKVDEDGIATRDWESYPILTFSEAPAVITQFVGSADDPPLGMGEVALGPVTAAIANAVAHALGARIRDLPLSRERLVDALTREA